jgi:penicillin G amidase
MQKVKFGFSLILLLAWCWLLNRPVSILPPLGKFLSPTQGFWQNCENAEIAFDEEVTQSGLKGEASVLYDERRVPHIFAANMHDLIFLQGYVTARDRLFQMDVQTRAAGGKVSEWFSVEAAINNDKRMRRLGLPYGAERALAEMEKDPATKEILAAYAEGVNAWIHSLSYAEFPVEYKIIHQAPEDWTTLKTCLLFKMMALDLTGRTDDLSFTHLLALAGRPGFDIMFPLFPDSLDPIIPKEKLYDFAPVTVTAPASYRPDGLLLDLEYPQPDENNGSNNWVVSGSKTATGYPMLANDPHLGLSLPSLWYEVQLNMPGMNVYGVSLPGAPLVVIGFNENVAWGLTNAQRDVLDWYRITFRDETHKEYKFGDGWEKTRFVYEKMNIKGKGEVIDTVMYTRYGPIVYDKSYSQDGMPLYIACKWAAHEPSNEMLTFLKLATAKGYDDYYSALQYYECPGQNFVFASNANDIAITQQGRFPVRWKDQGRFLLDGSNPLHDWQAWIPNEQNPTMKNPAQGYLSSANQHAVAPNYPYEIQGSYEHFRNRRINQVLSQLTEATIGDMKKLQNDNFNLNASENLDTLLKMLDRNGLNASAQSALKDLEGWNLMNDSNSTAASVWEAWTLAIREGTFDDEGQKSSRPITFPYPKDYTISWMVKNDPGNLFFDNVTTTETEHSGIIVTRAFSHAVATLEQWRAEHDNKPWMWSDYRGTEINHLVKLFKPFSRFDIRSGGAPSNVNSVKKGHGPSWKMVVQLGEKGPVAYGVYPGGVSGNPGSHFYENGVDVWASGNYFDLRFFNSPKADNPNVKFVQKFKP